MTLKESEFVCCLRSGTFINLSKTSYTLKKHLLALAIAAVPAFAFAASGNTINFQGEVTDQTCAVAINGNAASPTVLLPTVAASQLAAAGATAEPTNFTIGVTGCMAPTTVAQSINTVFVGNQVTASGNLGNTGTATKVALQLLDPAAPAAPFNLSGVNGYAAPGLNLEVGASAASHDFAVQYISEEGGATPGSVLGSVQYAVSYQ
ncbi:major type 1 subunit fimbrin (pilin) [Paraburkholderia sp. WSM4179]|uniref:fimbrial protein n=1 Tax=Paraburkholderia sp. WSM4179 TaxID=2991073 RepID=UPI001EF8AECF|nr:MULTISPECIES: fimbrial protein [Paraburkholderia]MDH6153023.1 major type 1 subunit fimbrin (pilin) [Paraburkholderia sp. WSM4179]